jgi:hypothetical protein
MKPMNFNWFLHTILFYHTRNVLEKAKQKDNRVQNNKDDADEDSD